MGDVAVAVRYFAGAAEAAGATEETVSVRAEAGVPTAGELRTALVGAHGADLARVLGRCALLAAGTRLDDDAAPVPLGAVVDVLPPFAGG